MLKEAFSPINIGKVDIPNRFVVPPMVMNFCNSDGTATERFIAYHEAKAKGGWGLIITEDYAVDPTGKGFSNIPGLWEDSQIESHSKLTERIHKHNSKIFAQIYHAGRQTNSAVIGSRPLAPSSIPCPVNQEPPHELSVDEVKEMIEKFGDCALRAKKAGFDGVEVHGAHGYLIAQFMSPYTNKRTDEYGGSFYNRMRFPLEIIDNIKKKAGTDFPIIFRISADEFVPDGRTIEDTKAIALLLEEAGVDAIHVSVGVYASAHTIIPPSAVKHGWITDLAAEVKKVVNIPVIAVGRINDPFLVESIITSKKADLVSMGRASLADPELPKKALEGRFDEIRYCIGCMQGCIERLFENKDVKCLVNPTLGKETEFEIKPATKKKKVFVAGGGPAGMEAAMVASQRGHEVHLFEKDKTLGGQFDLAAVPPAKGEISSFIFWQKNQLQKSNVTVHLNTELTKDKINSEKPDVVIIASGSKPAIPDVSGINKPNVVTAHDVLKGNANVGSSVIVIGGGMVGSETANHLANHGKSAKIIEQLPEIATDVQDSVRLYLLKDLAAQKVEIFTNTKLIEIEDDGVVVEVDNKKEKIAADTVVLAVGLKPVNNLVKLKDQVPEVFTVGDAKEVRKALEAIEEGYKAGLEV